ncbi:hypothetical protein CHLRE_07g317908v5 [Chlamydomonas reinhardtii]|uniref:RecA family profile 1 domain-containing protein n=1 Tax=Chlamydomonas reinhardtii TaxID=3055 RepID=A0A2K3DIU2_CHLRE|nr:uncharacterized protein CHLRE_07g317908v5 [Chlamydomonas reinhardtii]PNW80448.1 hypothetical protein CHLRE_07g317908v5 [Chlamydomonas reinhardtii]
MWNITAGHRAPLTGACSLRAGTRRAGWTLVREPGSARTLALSPQPLKYINGASAELRANQRGQRAAVVVGAGGAGRAKRIYPCKYCGHVHSRYHGKCQQCGAFGAMPLEGEAPPPPAAADGVLGGRARGGGGAGVQALEQLQAAVAAASYGDGGATAVGGSGRSVGWVASNGGAEDDAPLSLRALSRAAAAGGLARQGRIPLSGRTGAEVQRVLGGGVVPGALVLLGGDPGVGKSTITLQVAAMMAHPEIDFDALEERRAAAGGSGGSGGGMGGGEEQEEDGGEGSEFEELERMDRTEFEGAGDERSAAQQARRLRGSRAEGGADGEEWEEGLEEEGELYDEGEGEAEEEEDQDEEGGARGAAVALQRHRTVLYVTAEETREQVVSRSRRMGLHRCDRVVVLCRSEMAAIVRAVLEVRPDAVVMDSINTVYLGSLPQAPGTVTQIRECGQLLLRLAKDHRIALFIIGHVTKGGEMAGPNMLAHMVDTVLYLEGDVAQSVRLLRVVKNRHGSDAECGVFSMDGSGLHAVANQSALFLESRMADAEGGADGADDLAASSVVGVTMQGSRAILVEVQALVSPLGERAAAAASALSYRSATGVDKGRLATLCAILDKHVPTLELANCSVIVNVVGGAQVRDVASDLAIAVAVAASYYNVAVPRDLAVCGEVDLAGRVRCSFQRLDVRVREAAKLGFRRVVIPRTKGWERLVSDGQLAAAGVEVVAVRTVAEALLAGLGAGTADHRPPHVKPPARGKPPPGTGRPGSRFTRSGPPVQQQHQEQAEEAVGAEEQQRQQQGEWHYMQGGAAATGPEMQQPYPDQTSYQDPAYQQQLSYQQQQYQQPYPQQPQPYIAVDSAWPRAAAMGGVAAAYAAAAAAPPYPGAAPAPPAEAYGEQWGGGGPAAAWQGVLDLDSEAVGGAAHVLGGSYGSYGEAGERSGGVEEQEAEAEQGMKEQEVEALRPQFGYGAPAAASGIAGRGGVASAVMVAGVSADGADEDALEGMSLRQRRKGRRPAGK